MKSRAVVATALLALFTMPFADAVATKKPRNGVRLVGGSGARGRLEVSSTASWMLADGESVAWRPVCAVGGLIDNGVAQIMCKLLGYKYGRRYFSPDVSYRPPNPNASIPEQSNPVGYVYCNANTRRRRLGGDTLPVGDDDDASSAGHSGGDGVAGAVAAAAAATGSSATAEAAVRALDDGRSSSRTRSSSSSGGGGGGGGSTTRRQRHARSLLAPLYGFVDMPHDAPYSCQFRLGDCDYTGPLVGIECFKRRMPPAPPPPPSPPRAPQTPPPASMSIRLYGPNGGPLERNLCAASPGLCSYFNRVELQVPSPAAGGTGAMIWAPLCSAPPALLQAVGEVVCWQVYNWPRFANRPDFTVISEPSELGFPIPAGLAAETNATASASPTFDPTKVASWATVTSSKGYSTALRVQDLELQVSSTPCKTGALFAVTCTRRS